MTLFWHSHFAASNSKVRSALLMQRYVSLLRRHALGRFEPLLQAISQDPAMLLGLEADANRKALPNPGFARSLMDAFTLGPGQYCEQDVAEAARAFTGWFVLRNQLRFIPREHDAGVKKILGQQGPFQGKDVVRIALQQPATPRFLVRKLYRWLISEEEEPSDALVAPLADSFAKNYEVLPLVETMLRSNWFFSPAAYRRRIKSPVEFAVGIVRGLEGDVSATELGQDVAALGQNLYHPPTSEGWAGGRHWINTATLVGRNNLASSLLASAGRYGGRLNPLAIAEKRGRADLESASQFLLDLFLQGDAAPSVLQLLSKSLPRPASPSAESRSQWLRLFAHAVVTLPEFQLA
jgi:uncharacterized protein (DUF1800 family)